MADETNDKQRLDEHGLDTLLSNLSNKVASKTSLASKVDKVTSATNGNIAEFTSSGNIADSGVSVDDIVEVAEGKTATYIVNLSQNEVFNSQNDTVTTTKIITVDGTEINVSEIRKGDIILVTDTNVPDRWFGGTNVFYKMETSKIDLSSYYTRTETDAKFVEQISGKQLSTNDYSDAEKSKVENSVTSKSPISYTPSVPRDADTLGGIGASEYALKSELIDKMNVVIMDAFTSIDDFVRGVNTIAQNYNVSIPTMIRANISGHESIGIMIRWGVGFVVYILKEKNIYYSNYYSDTPHTITVV